jgi:hypothetical protein
MSRGRLRNTSRTPVLLGSKLTDFQLEVSLNIANYELEVHILALLRLKSTFNIGLLFHTSHKIVKSPCLLLLTLSRYRPRSFLAPISLIPGT